MPRHATRHSAEGTLPRDRLELLERNEAVAICVEGLDGIGDATKLPIGTVDKLFLGAENSNVEQLAIGLSTMDNQSDMLYYIGDNNKSPMAVAYIESAGQIST